MLLRSNGNLIFEPGEKIPLLTIYQQTKDNPLEFEPKFDEPCEVRTFQGRQCPNSQIVTFKWWCILRQFYTTIKDCRACYVPKAERNIQTAKDRGIIRDCGKPRQFREQDSDVLGTESEH